MLRLALWGVVFVVALGTVACVSSLLFRGRVVREARELWAAGTTPRPLDRARMEALPAPVRLYLSRALGQRRSAVRTVRLRHGGEFRTTLDGSFVPIRGEQYFAADPPGFVWWGRIRMAPGLWVDARDRSTKGVGNMLVRLESAITLADAKGPELDQGALLRLLGEMTWFPTAFLDDRYVSWGPVDDRHAQGTLRLAGREVTCVFEFGADGLVAAVRADRYRDLGKGSSALTPWSGESSDYREVDGLLIPHRQTAYWHLDGRPVAYARFDVERVEYDVASTF